MSEKSWEDDDQSDSMISESNAPTKESMSQNSDSQQPLDSNQKSIDSEHSDDETMTSPTPSLSPPPQQIINDGPSFEESINSMADTFDVRRQEQLKISHFHSEFCSASKSLLSASLFDIIPKWNEFHRLLLILNSDTQNNQQLNFTLHDLSPSKKSKKSNKYALKTSSLPSSYSHFAQICESITLHHADNVNFADLSRCYFNVLIRALHHHCDSKTVHSFLEWILSDHHKVPLLDPTRCPLSIVHFTSFFRSIFLFFIIEYHKMENPNTSFLTEWRPIWKLLLETLQSLQCDVVDRWKSLKSELCKPADPEIADESVESAANPKSEETPTETSTETPYPFLFRFCLHRYFESLCYLFCVFDDGDNESMDSKLSNDSNDDSLSSLILDIIGFALFHSQSVHHFQGALEATEWFKELQKSTKKKLNENKPPKKRRKLNEKQPSSSWTSLFFERVHRMTSREMTLRKMVDSDAVLNELGLKEKMTEIVNSMTERKELSISQMIGGSVYALFVGEWRQRFESELKLEMTFGCELIRILSSSSTQNPKGTKKGMYAVYETMHSLNVYRPNLDWSPFQNEWISQRLQRTLYDLEHVNKKRTQITDYFEGLIWTLSGLCRLNYDIVHSQIDRIIAFR